MVKNKNVNNPRIILTGILISCDVTECRTATNIVKTRQIKCSSIRRAFVEIRCVIQKLTVKKEGRFNFLFRGILKLSLNEYLCGRSFKNGKVVIRKEGW